MSSKKIAVILTAIILVAILLASTTYGAIYTTQNLSSSGNVTVSANIGVYSNAACTTPLTSIAWGSLSPGGATTQTLYIKNTGQVSLTVSITASNWSPSGANNYITMDSNILRAQLAPGESTQAMLTLSVSSAIVNVQSFSVQISITGSSS